MNTITIHPSGRLSFGEVRKNFKPKFTPKLTLAQRQRQESIGVIGVTEYAEMSGKPLSSMDLSNLSNSQKSLESPRRAKRGSGGLTGHGRMLVKNAAYWLQREYGKECLAFWTVTVPPENLNELLIESWSQVVRLLKEKLIYHLEKNGLPKFIVGVSEIQSKRWMSEGGLPPLHLHIVFVAAKRPYVPILGKELLAKLWGDTLENFSGVKARVDSISNVQFVRKDVVGYIGKYMSKGVGTGAELPPRLVPASWYFCTQDLRMVVKALIVKHSGEWVNDLYEFFRRNQDMFRFTKEVILEFGDGGKIKVGWYGDLREDAFDTAYQITKDMFQIHRLDESLSNPCAAL